MIDQEVMDRIVRVPDEDDEMEEKIQELKEAGFVITNFSKGGIFYTLLRITVHVGVQLKQLAVELINSAFMRHCPDDWVEIRAADYAKYRKDGTKAEGYVTVYRSDTSEPVKIAKGHPFRTQADAYGNYLKFYALKETVIPEGAGEYDVLVQAEEAGTAYNVAAGRICETLVHIEGYDQVVNQDGWLVSEGQEQESIESLRLRCLNSRAENAERNIDRKIKSIVESVSGVMTAYVDSQHPRGQGTCDVIVIGASGTTSEQTLQLVREAIEPLTGSYGDFLVKGAQTLAMDIDVDVYIEKGVSTEGYAESITSLLAAMMDVTQREELNVFYRDTITGTLAGGVDRFRKCTIRQPEEDMEEEAGTVIIKGAITVNVYNVGR